MDSKKNDSKNTGICIIRIPRGKVTTVAAYESLEWGVDEEGWKSVKWQGSKWVQYDPTGKKEEKKGRIKTMKF